MKATSFFPKKAPGKKRAGLLLIAGPCVLESEKQALIIGKKLAKMTDALGYRFVFKASFDKANRTSGDALRGPGMRAGLKMLASIRRAIDRPVLTDVHEISQVADVARVVDVLQIPAFLCRQTDLIQASARTGRVVNVKKGQFLAPQDVDAIAKKLRAARCSEYWITERGTTFGYQNLVVDMRGLAWMRAAGHPVIFDATHSVQRPGGLGTSSGGDAAMAPVLARAAVAAGVDGLFIETHPDPKRSPSDGPNMIPLDQMEALLTTLKEIHEAAR